MVHEQLKDENLRDKFVICSPYGTHGAIDVWEDEYGYFDTQQEAETFLEKEVKKTPSLKNSIDKGYLYVRETAIPWYPYKRI